MINTEIINKVLGKDLINEFSFDMLDGVSSDIPNTFFELITDFFTELKLFSVIHSTVILFSLIILSKKNFRSKSFE